MHMAQNAFARCAEKVNTRKNLTLNRQAVGEVVSYCTMIAANDTLDFNRDKQERLCTEMNHRAEVYTVEMSAYGQPKAREKLRERTAPIKGIAMDGMPHGSTPGDSTASLAVKLADDVECQRRENELRVRQDVLRADQTTIRGQLDRLNSRYKTILCGRYVYSDPSLQKGWKTIACELRKTEITAQRWEKFALVVLGSMLDEVPMVEELLSRAYDARD